MPTLAARRYNRRTGMGATPVTDFFRAIYLQADQEDRVILVNNYLQLLWRTALASGLTTKDPSVQKLDATMGQWVAWKQQYDAAVLRRWIPMTRAWSNELDTWSDRVSTLQTELDAASAGRVSTALQQKGLDPSVIAPDAGDVAVHQTLMRLNELLRSAWLWPVVGTVGALIIAGMALSLYRGVKAEVT